MSDYFNPIPTTVPAGTRALSSHVNAVANSISAGFDKLPTENQLKLGLTRYAVDTGVADAYIITLPYVPVLTDGFSFTWKAVNANTGAATINVNSTGVKSIENPDGSALIASTFGANAIIICAYESVNDRYILVSQNPAQAAAAAASAAAASISEGNASISAGDASTSETNAAASAAAAEASYDSFDDRYLGPKASDPALDNDGNALVNGALYWNTTDNPQRMYGYDGNLVSWNQVFAAGDASTLDSLDSTQFLRSDAEDTITTGVTTGTSLLISEPNATTGLGLEVLIGQASGFTGAGMLIQNPNGGDAGSRLLDLQTAGAANGLLISHGTTQYGIRVNLSGNGRGMLIDDQGAGIGAIGLQVNNSANPARTEDLVNLGQDANATAKVLAVSQSGTGKAVEIMHGGTTGTALDVYANVSGRLSPLVNVHNDHPTGTAVGALVTQDGTGNAVTISCSNASQTGHGLDVSVAGTGKGVFITHTGTDGFALDVNADNASRATAVANITQDHASSAATALNVQQDGIGDSIAINSTNAGAANPAILSSYAGTGIGHQLVSNNASQTGVNLTLSSAGSGSALQIAATGSGIGVSCSITGTNRAAYFATNNAATTNPTVEVLQDHVSATVDALSVTQDGTGNAVNAIATNAASTALRAYSNVASRTQPLVEIINDNATGSGVALAIQQDQGGAAIEINGDPVLPARAVVTGHIRAGNTQIIDGESTTTGITLSSVVTEATWESIGPTGSGADNIWAQMDDIPAEATILLVQLQLTFSAADANTANIQFYATNGDDSTPALSNTSTRQAHFAIDTDVGITGLSETSFNLMIPLGATNQDFQVFWDSFNTDSNVVVLYYRGFMTD